MKIAQQKEIKGFLVETFGKERGNALFEQQGKAFKNMTGIPSM